MKVPISWLKEYVNITVPIPALAERMTLAGLEVSGIDYIGVEPPTGAGQAAKGKSQRVPWDRERIWVGQILEVRPHPNADRLTLATVEFGHGAPLTVVTGAPNIRPGEKGQKVPFAQVGAKLIDGHYDDGRLLTLKAGKIRGVASEGMVCSEKELGLSDDHEGILILPDDAPVSVPLADYLGDVVLEVEITPNMARCMSIIGIAREVAALTGQKLRLAEPAMQAAGAPIAGQVAIEIPDSDLCNRYSATLIRGVTIGPSPFWLRHRLRLAGMRPISNVVDVTNYVMWEWGQPLHAFDYDKLAERAGGRAPIIIIRRARAGEKMTTLDGVARDLTTDMLLITDTAGPIAVAGVMGGAETEVTEQTRNILLESANFHNINNRRTSQALRLPSEASQRFGRGVPAGMTIPAATRATELMRVLASGVIAQGYADAYPVPQETSVVEITPGQVERILGMKVSAERITAILESLEFRVEKVAPEVLRCTVPWQRLDVSIAADLIEEVARVIGYDQIPTTLFDDTLPPQRRNLDLEAEERIRDILIGCGLQDTIAYSLVGQDTNHRLLAALNDPDSGYTAPGVIPCLLPPAACIRLANPLTPEHDTMRTSLAPSALMILRDNLRFRDRIAQFEIGRVYWPRENQLLPDEPRHLCLVLTGPRESLSWHGGSGEMTDFYDLKGIVEALLSRLGIADARFAATTHPAFGPRVARLTINGVDAGILGELHPQVRAAFDLPAQRVSLAEFALAPFLAAFNRPQTVTPLSAFPAVREDLAFIVDEGVTAEKVLAVMRAAGGDLLRAVELFDLYRGAPIPAGRKSLAYRLTYQADDRTLSADAVERLRNRIVKRVQQELGAELRG
ncbi:MAG: phenylalanine--tRNA ligase subunit beta [Anaerolineae bacterium]|nr:phenylalanine--tRNA ligase subunit beta [Anaerolineae bacterium]